MARYSSPDVSVDAIIDMAPTETSELLYKLEQLPVDVAYLITRLSTQFDIADNATMIKVYFEIDTAEYTNIENCVVLPARYIGTSKSTISMWERDICSRVNPRMLVYTTPQGHPDIEIIRDPTARPDVSADATIHLGQRGTWELLYQLEQLPMDVSYVVTRLSTQFDIADNATMIKIYFEFDTAEYINIENYVVLPERYIGTPKSTIRKWERDICRRLNPRMLVYITPQGHPDVEIIRDPTADVSQGA